MDFSSSPEAATAQPLFDGPSQNDFFGYLLMRLDRNWRKVLELRLAELGLTDATWVPLFHLHAAGDGISLKALAQRVSLDSSSLVRVVDMLEAQGLVERVTDTADRRSKQLWLTPSGRATIADVHGKLQRVEQQLLAGMAPDAVAALQQGMLQLTMRLEQVLTAPPSPAAQELP